MTPRPALLFTVTFGAGLATGLLRFRDPAGVTGVGLAAIVAVAVAAAMAMAMTRARRGPWIFCMGCGVAGLAAASLAHASDARSCATRLPAGRIELTLRVIEPVVGSGIGGARPEGAGCP